MTDRDGDDHLDPAQLWTPALIAQCLKQWNGPLGDLTGRDVQLIWTGARWAEVIR